MPVLEVSRGAGRRLLSGSFDDLLSNVEGVTSPTATGMAHTSWIWQSDKHVVGGEAFIHTGGGLGQARDILSFTPFSAGSTLRVGILGFIEAFSPIPSINSEVEIHKMFTVEQYNNALERAIRRAALTLRVPRDDFSLILNSPLENGTFQHWTSGTSVAPDGWTLGGGGGGRLRSAG